MSQITVLTQKLDSVESYESWPPHRILSLPPGLASTGAGGLLFDLVALANLKGIDAESALRKAVRDWEKGLEG